MGLEGRKISENQIVFGEPASGKALEALQKNSPTAESILSSLPPSAFIPIQEKTTIVSEEKLKEELEEKQKLEEKVNMAKYRRERKRKQNNLQEKRQSQLKKDFEEEEKEVIIEKTSIEKIIEEKETKEESMNLEEELAALEKELAEKKAAKAAAESPKIEIEEETDQPEMKDQILELLSSDPNAPGVETVNAWKERFGANGIHVMAFGEGDIYIFHHLTRGEWRKIKDLMSKLAETDDQETIEEKLKEKVVLYCVLYPSIDERWLDYCKAGILDSLYQMILLNSGFLTPQQAMLLTTSL